MGNLKKNRRAQAEAQFNWIFVLIVGGIIMLFFTTIVLKQKASSEQKISATVITDLEAIFTGASISKGTTHLLDVPKVDIEFDCNRFYLGQVNRGLGKQIVFAPSRVAGTKLLTWTLEWNAPFKVTNFLYITSPEVRYILIHDGSEPELVDLINTTLPKEMELEVYEFQGDMESLTSYITDQNNYKVRIIFLGRFNEFGKVEEAIEDSEYFPGSLSGMDSGDLTALFIDTSSSSDSIKSLYFYNSAGSRFVLTDSTYSLDYTSFGTSEDALPSLFGAVFADDVDSYNCIMRKAFERLELISEVFLDKAEKLKTHYDIKAPNLKCKNMIESRTIGAIEGIRDGSKDCLMEFPDQDCVKQIDNNMAAQSDSLDVLNRRLLLMSCALIY